MEVGQLKCLKYTFGGGAYNTRSQEDASRVHLSCFAPGLRTLV